MSNEQRAHDLSLLYIELINNYKQPDESNNLEINPVKDYLEIYPKVLEAINCDFPLK